MRTQMLEQAAIDHEIEATQYTDANLKKAWESYHPDVTAYVVSETSKDAATKALDAAKKMMLVKQALRKQMLQIKSLLIQHQQLCQLRFKLQHLS